jgi:hypothetical protein
MDNWAQVRQGDITSQTLERVLRLDRLQVSGLKVSRFIHCLCSNQVNPSRIGQENFETATSNLANGRMCPRPRKENLLYDSVVKVGLKMNLNSQKGMEFLITHYGSFRREPLATDRQRRLVARATRHTRSLRLPKLGLPHRMVKVRGQRSPACMTPPEMLYYQGTSLPDLEARNPELSPSQQLAWWRRSYPWHHLCNASRKPRSAPQ